MSEQNETKPVEENNDEAFLKKYDTVFAFLSLETLALLCFGFGGTLGITILRIFGFFLSLLTMSYAKANADKESRKAFWIGLLPLGLMAIFLGVSSFWISFYGSGLSAIITDLTVVLGFAGAFLLGYHVKHIGAAKPDYVLLALGAGLALFVTITGLYSFVRYGFFYSALHSGKVYYYDGVVYSISSETKSLIGFEFFETSMKYGKAASVLLASFLPALLFGNPKKTPRRFLLVAVFGCIGLLDLILTPYWFGLLVVLGVAFVLGAARIFHAVERKSEAGQKAIALVRKILFLALIAITAIAVVILVIDSSGTAPGRILSKLGVQRISASLQDGGFLYSLEKGINAVLYSTGSDGIRHWNFLGMLFGTKYTSQTASQLSRFFEFNVLWQNGFVGFLLLAYFCFLMVKQSNVFLHRGAESESLFRAVLVAVLLAGLLYFSFGDDEVPLRHADSQLFSFTRSNFALVLFFLSGLIYTAKGEKQEVAA